MREWTRLPAVDDSVSMIHSPGIDVILWATDRERVFHVTLCPVLWKKLEEQMVNMKHKSIHLLQNKLHGNKKSTFIHDNGLVRFHIDNINHSRKRSDRFIFLFQTSVEKNKIFHFLWTTVKHIGSPFYQTIKVTKWTTKFNAIKL